MSHDWKDPKEDITDLLDTIIRVIPEAPYREGTPQMQITSLDFSSFVGRIAIGRVYRGDLNEGQDYAICKVDNVVRKVRVKELFVFEGLGTDQSEVGEIGRSLCHRGSGGF